MGGGGVALACVVPRIAGLRGAVAAVFRVAPGSSTEGRATGCAGLCVGADVGAGVDGVSGGAAACEHESAQSARATGSERWAFIAGERVYRSVAPADVARDGVWRGAQFIGTIVVPPPARVAEIHGPSCEEPTDEPSKVLDEGRPMFWLHAVGTGPTTLPAVSV